MNSVKLTHERKTGAQTKRMYTFFAKINLSGQIESYYINSNVTPKTCACSIKTNFYGRDKMFEVVEDFAIKEFREFAISAYDIADRILR